MASESRAAPLGGADLRSVARIAWGLTILLVIAGLYLVVSRGMAIAGALHGGTLPSPNSFEAPFAQRPLLAFLHLFPALVFVVLGPLQLTRRVRERFPAVHRLSGRVYLVAGALVAYSAVHLVLRRSFGGASEAAATLVFAMWLVCCLGVALARIRRGRIREHREWMIRGFAIGLAVITIRPVVGVFLLVSDYSVPEILGVAFWISFTLHLLAAEVWIHLTRVARDPRRGVIRLRGA